MSRQPFFEFRKQASFYIKEKIKTARLVLTDVTPAQLFNWGLVVRKKSERVLKLLEKGSLLKEERENARKLTREIKGFGSFSSKTTSQHTQSTFGRSHSQFNEHGNEDNFDEKISFDQPRLIILGEDNVKDEKPRIVKRILKENKAPKNDIWKINLEEKNSLLDEQNGGLLIEEDEHPFNDNVEHSRT